MVDEARSAAKDRESREFFYVHADGRVSKVTGYACETNLGSYWWWDRDGVGWHSLAPITYADHPELAREVECPTCEGGE